jgi:hypothetical protein
MRTNGGLDRTLALLGLVSNTAGLPLLLAWILRQGPLALATLVVGLAAILPALVLGIVASAGLLARRVWGRVVAIVALALGLAVSLSYGIVWLLQLLLLIHWSRPRRR